VFGSNLQDLPLCKWEILWALYLTLPRQRCAFLEFPADRIAKIRQATSALEYTWSLEEINHTSQPPHSSPPLRQRLDQPQAQPLLTVDGCMSTEVGIVRFEID